MPRSNCKTAEEARKYHDSLKADLTRWNQLEFIGNQEYDETHFLELRNCARCGSTIAVIRPL